MIKLVLTRYSVGTVQLLEFGLDGAKIHSEGTLR
jgi:hypothetical protein